MSDRTYEKLIGGRRGGILRREPGVTWPCPLRAPLRRLLEHAAVYAAALLDYLCALDEDESYSEPHWRPCETRHREGRRLELRTARRGH